MGDVTPLQKGRPGDKPKISPPVALEASHDVSRFDCGKPALNDWLRKSASQSEGRTARCYVACVGNRVAGYFCLLAGAVERSMLPAKMRPHGTPNPVPVMTIGRLAVDREFQGTGLGKALLKDALLRILSASKGVGARAVLVHAVDNDVIPFYSNLGFLPFPTDAKTLYLPIETIAKAL